MCYTVQIHALTHALTVATYSCESWTLTKNEETRLDAFEMKGLRKILRVSRTAEKTNEWVFTARCYASAVLAMGLYPSVSVSVCLSQVGVLLKRHNVGSHKQHRTIPQGL